MLAETGESAVASPVRSAQEIRSQRPAIVRTDAAKFVAIVLQLVLLAILTKRYNLETPAFFQLMVLAFAGFIVHYFLPLAYRLPFFLVLSLVSIAIILGLIQGAALLAIGLVLIAICHVPLPFWLRIMLLSVAAALLAAMRGGWLSSVVPMAVWPILGSMFMFRMIVYLYDLYHGRGPKSVSESLSYFFMLPNICFPLFPVVDFQAYSRRYFVGDRYEIYQVGARWIFRGIVHLILYRILYHNWAIKWYEVENAGDLVHYCLWSFLLYLRVSGQFHVIVGMLHLFGFNLPETHHLYLLASSFTDFWRRINIYWKDFLMRIIFYPAYFQFRNLGTKGSLIVATLCVFFMTWLLHSVQWFWLTGSPLLSGKDMLFYAILAGLVVVNSLAELQRGQKRMGARSWRASLRIGIRTLATFTTICILWSMWTSESFAVWIEMWRSSAALPTISGWLIITCAVVSIVGAAAWMAREPVQVLPSFFQESALRCGLMCLLAGVSLSIVYHRLGYAGEMIASARSTALNREDQITLEQGYYEGLLAVDKFNGALADLYQRMPAKWAETIVEAGLANPTDDFQRFELKPMQDGMFKGAKFRTNRWGMHDKDYLLQAPAGCYRIAMLGASHAMGTGVDQEKTFEAILEDRLNRENDGVIPGKYEILNFSVWAYRPIQQIKVLEEKVLPFKPNAIFYVEHPGDTRRQLDNLAEAISHGIPMPYSYLSDICAQAKVDQTVPEEIIRRRLRPYANDILTWLYHRLVRDCSENHIKPIFVSLPPLGDETEKANISLARAAGFEIIDLAGVYDGHKWWDLILSEWDAHPTVEAHRLIAEKLYNELMKAGSIPMRKDDRANRRLRTGTTDLAPPRNN